MYLTACFLIMAAGLGLNAFDRRMLALTALVGASIFIPAPDTYEQFYVFCISAECLVGLLALIIRARASVLVAEICVLLVIAHLMGYSLDGSPPFSPYRVIVKLLEFSQLAACVALSPVLAPFLRNHETTTQ